jgi:hypothetical protein
LLVQKAFGSMRKQIRATISKVRCELQSKILARLHKATGRFASESVLYPLPLVFALKLFILWELSVFFGVKYCKQMV